MSLHYLPAVVVHHSNVCRQKNTHHVCISIWNIPDIICWSWSCSCRCFSNSRHCACEQHFASWWADITCHCLHGEDFGVIICWLQLGSNNWHLHAYITINGSTVQFQAKKRTAQPLHNRENKCTYTTWCFRSNGHQVVKVIWHTAASPQQTDGLIICFARWRQRSLPWRHLPDTIKLVLPSAHQSSQPKWQIDQFSHFCRAHCRNSLYFTMGAPFPQKNVPFNGDLDPQQMIPRALSPEPTTQTVSQFCMGSDVFAQMTAECPYTVLYTKMPLPPSKLPLLVEDLDPHLIHGSLGSSPQPKRHLDWFSHVCRAH